MNKTVLFIKQLASLVLAVVSVHSASAQVIISQYYEGTGTNKWIELTNTGNTAINTASPQLKLGIWLVTGSTGKIAFNGAATSTINLTVTIPAYGSVLIGNTGNGTEIPYLTAASAAQTSNTVINFTGNDGIALLNASNTIIDKFGTGINATDSSYVRNTSVTTPTATYTSSQWTSATIATVQAAGTTDPKRLGYQLSTPCTAPANQATSLTFGSPTSTSNTGSFTATTANGYLVVYSTAALSANPTDGTTYTAGNTLGNGTVLSSGASTSLSLSGLTPGTTYYVTVFAYNNLGCSGGITYKTTTPLTGSFATIAAPCVAPVNQATGLTFGSPTSTSNAGSFTASTADGYLVVYSAAPLSANPTDGTPYTVGNTLGNGTVLSSSNATSLSLNGLTPYTTYYITVFAYNNVGCSGGITYKTDTPLTGSFATIAAPCVAPADQPTALSFSGTTSATATGSFTTTAASGYLVAYSTAASLTASPANGTTYTTGATFGNATVVSAGSTNTFAASGLSASTTYYFYVFSYNNTSCSGGPVYKTTAPLTGSATTLEAPLYYYFGNFHSHSEYSDGTGLPSGDFSFGDTANCMDFLGISEHNHLSAGMSLANYALGRSQAAAATTPSFVAMYGMEWGVISGGGHVVVYGVDKLVGWDTNNYDIYVPLSTYTGSTGLFNVINSYSSSNAFATLAHPNNTDYNGIMSTYDSAADDAVVGSAVENGPSTSLDVTYTDPPSSMLYLSFYRNMLARGYHLGPTIDHDNHNVTHGHTATSRTVVLATALNESSVLSAMRAMRFYASEDCGAYVTFKVNNKPLGTIMTAAGAPTITVTTTTSNPVTSLKIYSGIAGSGTNATVLTSTTTGSISFTHTALANLASRYYYIDITESDGKRIVTAPIWYTRNDAARKSSIAAVSEFLAIAQPKKVLLKWATTQETKNQSYTIERSFDNIHFELLTTQAGKGMASASYSATDESYATGMVYYRLTQYDAQGDAIYTDTQKVNRTLESKFQLTVYPNPVGATANIQLENTQGEAINFSVYNLSGQMVYQQTVQSQVGDQEVVLPMNGLASGIYLVKATTDTYAVTSKITKL
ncbi:CehA/McbA family metallohydrolase [Flavobacterium paronense]|uniref:CehA/McbA family metallohydrolase n=1 Tax=Flavobacterium paronense TaxID=1392775 RepID=A0ABV5GCM7_9FLAO|nr:CehA/McbA family metallohydrolase [Flavobacterium paronense]MDN3676297.1 CehA/McbA family metallohydrolase [Flavobacterium paronense]